MDNKPKKYAHEIDRELREKEELENSNKFKTLFVKLINYYDVNYPKSTQDEIYNRKKIAKFELGDQLVLRELDLLTEEQLTESLYIYEYNYLEKQVNYDESQVWIIYLGDIARRIPDYFALRCTMNAERQAREDKREQKLKQEQLKKIQEKFEAERKVKLTQNAERKEQLKAQEKQQETLVKKEQEINQTAKFKCPKCNRGFNNKGSLTNHERSCIKKQEA